MRVKQGKSATPACHCALAAPGALGLVEGGTSSPCGALGGRPENTDDGQEHKR